MPGRKPGTPKTGGRAKGTPNKVTSTKAAEIAASGLTPLDFMLGILRDETRADAERFEAAKQAAPYCHAKLASVDASLDASLAIGRVIYPSIDD
jgi:hypothetical protein